MRGARAAAVAAVRDFFRDDMATSAAALSYHLFFALFPFLIFLLAGFHLLGLTGVFGWLVHQIESVAPSEVAHLLDRVVAQVDRTSANGILSLSILLSVWMTSAGMRSVMSALNRAYDVREDRPVWWRYVISVAYTLAFSALVLLSAVLVVLGPRLVALAAGNGVADDVLRVWRWVELPLAIVLALVAILLVYRFAPNGSRSLGHMLPGALLTLALWLAISFGFRYYVEHFGSYTAMYGSLGAVIVLLLYIFLSANALLLGAELNGTLERGPPYRRVAY